MDPQLLDWIDTGERERHVDLVARLAGAFAWADQHGIVIADGSVDHVRCEQCLSAHLSPIERIGASYHTYCYRTGKRVTIDPQAVAAVRPNAGAFANTLGRAVNAKGQVIERSKGRLWELGWVDVAGLPRALFFCRDIESANNLSTVSEHLELKGSKWAGIVLCSGRTPTGILLKSGHVFRPLSECMGFIDNAITLDMRLIESWARGLQRPKSTAAPDDTLPAPDWREPALRFWQELHKMGRLNANGCAMSRLVAERLKGMKPPLTEPPLPATIYKNLLPLHRQHYPRSRT